MSPLQHNALGRYSVQKILMVLVVLMMVSGTAVLFAHFWTPGATDQDAGYIEKGHQAIVVGEDPRDAQIAAEHGILGYLELSWGESLPPSVFNRGEAWSGIILVRFVSHSSKIAEVDLCLDPNGPAGLRAGKYYTSEDGSKQVFWFSSLLSYDPSGIVTLKADEIMPVKVTVRIPVDFPQEFESFRLSAMGIASVCPQIALIAGAVDAGKVAVR